MKRWARVLGTTVSIVTILGGVAAWNAAFRPPPINRLPIPDTLIAADTPAGRQLLTEKGFLSDYEGLTRAFEAQSRPGFCGVASSVVVLNALAGGTGHLTQSTFFTERASKVRTSLQVTFGGMTLEQLGALLQTHGGRSPFTTLRLQALMPFAQSRSRISQRQATSCLLTMSVPH
jgi:glutathione-S-conjugate glycine hydrolase